MTSETDLITRAYDAFNRRDIDAVMACMHADIDWPNVWEGGRLHGQAAVRAYWLRQWAAFSLTVIPEKIDTLPGGRLVVTVLQTVRMLDGALVAQGPIEHVYTVQDGLLRAMDIVVIG